MSHNPTPSIDVVRLTARLKTCLHYYVSSLPLGTLFCFALLAIPLWASFHGSVAPAMLPMSVYCLGCAAIFSLASPPFLQKLRALAPQIRWYRADQTFALVANASYPLAVVASSAFLFVDGPQKAALLNILTWHIVLSCVVRDGFGTVFAISKNMEDGS